LPHPAPRRALPSFPTRRSSDLKIASRGTRLVVSADCGVTAVAEVDAAARLGLDVVVIDHHTASQDLPRAVAILNPHQPGCTFPGDRKSTRLNSSHLGISYAVFC